ncbi:MAG: tRNA-specific adenosine deaminase [candidate division Zixibacteria bacterium]|nr:tRNA-specific adenosine deaminase [candidate division Zixibacteria bacterium]
MIGDDEYFMNFALREAQKGLESQEVPVGCVIVLDGVVIGRGHNQIESLQDPTAHAEILAITAAANYLTSRRLERCTAYVTLEPCAMCCGALNLARVERLVFGAYDPKAGAAVTLYKIPTDSRLNHVMEVEGGLLAEECGAILSEFFRKLRRK